MKVQNITDPAKLFEVIDSCQGKVELFCSVFVADGGFLKGDSIQGGESNHEFHTFACPYRVQPFGRL